MTTTDTFLAQITTYETPSDCPLGVGSVIAYEDMANPYREGTILGFAESRWGTSAIVQWHCPVSGEYYGSVTMGSLQSAKGPGEYGAGFRTVAAA